MDFTERKQAEEALRESEQRLQWALQVAGGGAWDWDLTRDEAWWSNEMYDLWGVEPGTRMNLDNSLAFVHEQDRICLRSAIEKSLAGRTDFQCEFRTRHPMRGERWMVSHGRPLFEQSGRPRRLLGITQDITERKQVELEIRKFVSLADNSSEFIGMCDMNYVPFYVNKAGRRLVGLDDVLQYSDTPVKDFFFPDDQDFIINDFFPRVMREGRAEVEIRFRHFKTAEPLWMIYDVFHLTGEGDQPIGLATVSRNITERKLAEEALRESKARFGAIVDTAADAIIVIDESGVIQSINPATQTLFGYALDELVERNIKVLMPEQYARAHDGYLEAYKRTGIRKVIGIGREVEGRRKDGSKFPLDLTVAEWRDARGRRFFTGIMRDSTERKRAEETLERARRLDAVGQLAGGIAHDFNNLLSVIAGNLELAEPGIEHEKTRKLIRKAIEAAETGANFNRRLLSLTRKRELEPMRLVVNTRVIETIKLLERALGAHVELITDLAEGLWPTHADPSEIDSAILNLAVNARDAMPAGGKLVIRTDNVTLDASAAKLDPEAHQGDYVRLSVADNGVGMSQEVLQHAFEPFFTTKEPGKGTGLGLSSVFGFARQSGGFATIASEIGKGTTVSLYLPRAAPGLVTAGAPAATKDALFPGDGELILVVEDDDNLRDVTLKRLEVLGYAVLEARTGPEAIEQLRSGEPIALVFSDIVMPGGMTGYELARWVLAAKPHVKALLTSGYDAGVRRRDDREVLGNIKTLVKPYTLAQLGRSIRETLDSETAQVGLTSPVNT